MEAGLKRLLVAVALAALLLLVCVAVAALAGSQPISLLTALRDPASLDRTILVGVRLPRIALAAVAGGGLAAVGVAFQAVLRNPLAEPYVLGVSGGAALGATVAIVAAGGMAATALGLLVPAAALAGGLGATALVYAVARAGGSSSGASILLAGVIVNAIAGALITFIKTLVSASKAQELLFWLMGFLDVPSPVTLLMLVVYVGVGAAVLVADSGRMNLLSLGDEPAQHLGVDVKGLERRVYLACSLVVGAIVSVTGLIGFVGLVVPHALRRVLGPDHRVLVPVSLLAGGAMLVLCDLVSRAAFQWLGTEPPVGAVTALVGGPVFLLLLRRRG
ncbi:MAG TPA: iron ABC transporter permease [Polyangiaceae bacterium]|nr:iron ABC transporter permease [Polyangiaceae bacterium]